MIYFVDATGAIVSMMAAASPEQEAQAAVAGLTRVEDQAGFDRDSHFYVDGAFAAKPAQGQAAAIAAAACAKRLELARQAEEFISRLTPPEHAAVRAADPSRTDERYPPFWLQWARGQNDMATLIAAHAAASPEQIARAEQVKSRYLALACWCARLTAGPLAAAFANLESAAANGDIQAIENVELNLSAHQIGASGEHADPDPDITQAMLQLPAAGLALLDQS
ncbi:hypothetical protein Deba_2737 [Desulfarculus baarsii DSM 2075]|uniref:Uncharacterized protein n=1 Tax=Desulfarculus baarsii (strain ATCC 33931 / DSM 2075 / LMG 7858 / VKM B-1802 / 2st14) TaxID=644282 RepID=E1QKJ8_DESB2|nr:hypothetical protein [Desulfarculus baarsii]ADK86091.1 hypothetical protein Deba_2737 [Desulfarculus baarsii DSM 2075]